MANHPCEEKSNITTLKQYHPSVISELCKIENSLLWRISVFTAGLSVVSSFLSNMKTKLEEGSAPLKASSTLLRAILFRQLLHILICSITDVARHCSINSLLPKAWSYTVNVHNYRGRDNGRQTVITEISQWRVLASVPMHFNQGGLQHQKKR